LTRKLVLRGGDGVVFVADSEWTRLEESVESFASLEENLHEYGYELDSTPYVLQYNKRDLPDAATRDYMEFLLNWRSRRVPSFESVATRGAGIYEALNTVSRMVLSSEFGQEQEAHRDAS